MCSFNFRLGLGDLRWNRCTISDDKKNNKYYHVFSLHNQNLVAGSGYHRNHINSCQIHVPKCAVNVLSYCFCFVNMHYWLSTLVTNSFVTSVLLFQKLFTDVRNLYWPDTEGANERRPLHNGWSASNYLASRFSDVRWAGASVWLDAKSNERYLDVFSRL